MKNNQITYLLGAGASFNHHLPSSANFASKIQEIITVLITNFMLPKNSPLKASIHKIFEGDSKILNDLPLAPAEKNFIVRSAWLVNQSKQHASVDTFAKKLYLINKDDDLSVLKAVVSSFFMLAQSIATVDTRYDTFWATILSKWDNHIALPLNIKIISWNYDNQIELSFSKYLFPAPMDFSEVYDVLQSLPLDKFKSPAKDFDYNIFGIFGLNGIASAHFDGEENKIVRLFDLFKDEKIPFSKRKASQVVDYFDKYLRSPANYRPLIDFAWENSSVSEANREIAFKIAENTDILVIIGYSFPNFNRPIDKMLLNKMTKLKKIYIQDISDNILKEIQGRCHALLGRKITTELKPDKHQFYIPNEFDVVY